MPAPQSTSPTPQSTSAVSPDAAGSMTTRPDLMPGPTASPADDSNAQTSSGSEDDSGMGVGIIVVIVVAVAVLVVGLYFWRRGQLAKHQPGDGTRTGYSNEA